MTDPTPHAAARCAICDLPMSEHDDNTACWDPMWPGDKHGPDLPSTAAPRYVRVNGDSLWLWCPGCQDSHRVVVFGANAWTWNKNTTLPTITPSIKVTGVQWAPDQTFHKSRHNVEPGEQVICHSFLTDGQWQFLTDSTHVLAGQTVPMEPLPDWLAEVDDALHAARRDKAFRERLTTRMREDKHILDRLAGGEDG